MIRPRPRGMTKTPPFELGMIDCAEGISKEDNRYSCGIAAAEWLEGWQVRRDIIDNRKKGSEDNG